MTPDPSSSLRGIPEKQYGTSHQDHLLEQYKLYVQMADKISERRQGANAYFLTINTALVSLLALAWPTEIKPFMGTVWHALAACAGMILCYSWYRLVRSYRDLNSGKFRVIHEIENYLPLRPYAAEWISLGRGDNPNLYLPFTHIEILVPWVFFVMYLVVATVPILSQAANGSP